MSANSEQAKLEAAFNRYRVACYGSEMLPAAQLKEIRQAFFSGIHYLNCRSDYFVHEVKDACRQLTGVDNVRDNA